MIVFLHSHDFYMTSSDQVDDIVFEKLAAGYHEA